MLGTMRVGMLNLPITRIRLVGGTAEITASAVLADGLEATSNWVELFGIDGQPVQLEKPSRVEVPAVDRGGRLSLILPVRFAVSWPAPIP